MTSSVPAMKPSILRPRLYWQGNAAKMRVINELLERSGGRGVVFDYGAGRGGDWPDILADHPGLQLVVYEPHRPSRQVLAQRLAGGQVKILDDAALANGAAQADYIVSFSVFEHVYDRAAYLRQARANLKPGGTFFLNYDDGHFRQQLELDRPSTWPAALAEHARNLLAPLWPKVGREHLYQQRLDKTGTDALIRSAGLEIVADIYENMADLKRLVKAVPAAQQEDFCRFWLETEERLNHDFRAGAAALRGDDVNLWQVCLSRTLELVHA